MSDRFAAYIAISASAAAVAVLIMGPRRLLRTSSIVRWYLLVFALTYIVRPLGSQWWGNTFLYEWLDLQGFDPYWKEITAAVAVALLSFAVGYRLARAPRGLANSSSIDSKRNVLKAKELCAWIFIVVGYVSIPFAARQGGTVLSDPYTGFGIFHGTSFYLTNANILTSSGAVLLYAATGKVWLAGLAAVPWLATRISFGWQRSDMMGFLFALLGVQAIRPVSRAGAHAQRMVLLTSA